MKPTTFIGYRHWALIQKIQGVLLALQVKEIVRLLLAMWAIINVTMSTVRENYFQSFIMKAVRRRIVDLLMNTISEVQTNVLKLLKFSIVDPVWWIDTPHSYFRLLIGTAWKSLLESLQGRYAVSLISSKNTKNFVMLTLSTRLIE